MRTFRLRVGYDGTAFHGWQVQPGQRTVQGVIEEGLRQVLEGEELRVHGAGRTDAGVHARGQVASFASVTPLPARAIAPLLRRLLPDDVRIGEAVEERPDFHARHSARGRHYSYALLDHPDVLAERFAWCPPRAPEPGALAAATAVLEREADFSAFRATGGSPGSPVCRVTRAEWSRWERGLELDIVADHFLYHMVRNVVATALAAAREPDPAGHLRAVLESRDRSRAAATAPARALCLEDVFYEEGE